MQIMRSSRGMLVAGAVLAIAAFILVVVLLQQKSGNSNAATATATPVPSGAVQATATAFVAQAAVTATVGPSLVQASRNVPAGTKLSSDALVRYYFKDVPVVLGQVPPNAVTSIEQWETDTNVISGTTFIGTLLITKPIASSRELLQGDYAVLPLAPPGSLAYHVDPGHVAEAIQLGVLQADDYAILPNDYVDLLLTIRQHEVDSLQSNPPTTTNSGPMETQEIVANAKVVATAPGGIFVLQLPIQDALLVKYVKDTGGNVDMVLISATDVKNQNPQPKTNPVLPEYFLTPAPAVKGIPGLPTQATPTAVNGVPYPLATPHPTATPAR